MSAKEVEKWKEQQQKTLEKSQEKGRKEQEKSRKQQEKSRKQQEKNPTPTTVASSTIRFDTVTTPEKVGLFFNDYVGKIIKFESLGIFELQAVPGTDDKLYGIDVSSANRNYLKMFSSSFPLNFVMNDTLAREVTQEQEEFIKTFPSGRIRRNVNIYAEMQRGKYEAKIAHIMCIEFIIRDVGIGKSLGSCN
jgi:hypothetical protein